ncbi:GMC family oxidoreductase [Actinoplanes sp. NPDC000266]
MTATGWDLIVVGAGSSGAALAARAAAKGRRVLLLEAGPDYRSADMHEAWRSPNPVKALMDPAAVDGMVWAGLDASRTDKQAPGPYWRGRGAGGSSAVNGQIAIRPPMEDYADWGLPGWAPADVLPYFAALENDLEYGDAGYHGRSGPTPIFRTAKEHWGPVDAVLAAEAIAAGYGWAPDVNAPGATGTSPYPINSRDGRRVTVNDAYLEPARGLPNLTIRGGALVDRVLFTGDRAVGVAVLDGDRELILHADEVVLSAGVIHSPAILLRSGIGPAAQLRGFDIGVRQDLPVGQGLQDHPMVGVSLPLVAPAAGRGVDDRHTNVCVRYTSDPRGPVNDMMFVAMNRNVLAMASADPGLPSGAFGVWVNQAHSRGVLTLASRDPRVHPEVRERMLSDERDLSRLRDGVRRLVELARGPRASAIRQGSLEEHNRELFAVLDDDGELGDFLLATAVDAQHGTSTCRMGAVVGPDCRVLGVESLRVVDASIFPSVPRANTNLAAIMTGELMADRL